MGEGAASLILEDLESARDRKAPILAEVLGYSLNNDAWHMAHSRDDFACALRAMQGAVEQAGLKPEQIDYVNAHGSSTEINDLNEARALQHFFGNHRPPVSGTKGFYGHPLGASGAIEAVLAVLILQKGWIPPTRGCAANAFPESIDLVQGSGRFQPVQTILSNSFGFGGINSSIVLGKYKA
jgi:3-oxoacyl-[acyl-carrier-protein] synthase II